MCDVGNVLKVAALGTAAYFGAPLLMGDAAAGAGAAAGSEAFASGVGAAGGDAMGSLIASNAGAWGVNVAPEIASLAMPAAAGAAGLSTMFNAQNITAGAAAANAGLGIIGAAKGSKAPPAPTISPPPVMPVSDSEATQRARRSMLQTLSQQRGRSSTILSNDTLGGN